ncbi:IS1 family transposase, partial [Enterobacter hormaechei]|uniref:IS1 family transposase n=1 Tax=Enterobacter hormaechei TaxID=158836 RepID=UPI001F54F7C2
EKASHKNINAIIIIGTDDSTIFKLASTLYESRLKGKLHVISKRYTQRIERHNLNLRQHLARLGRKSLSFSKSVELHDKVIGHYLNIKHYQ